MQPLGKLRHQKSPPPRERAQARTGCKTSLRKQIEASLKSPQCIREEEMQPLGKLRHQRKSFSPSSEFRQDETERSRVSTILGMGKEGR